MYVRNTVDVQCSFCGRTRRVSVNRDPCILTHVLLGGRHGRLDANSGHRSTARQHKDAISSHYSKFPRKHQWHLAEQADELSIHHQMKHIFFLFTSNGQSDRSRSAGEEPLVPYVQGFAVFIFYFRTSSLTYRELEIFSGPC